MNHSRLVNLSSPDLRLRNYICRAMMGEVGRPTHLYLIKQKLSTLSATKVSELLDVMGSYPATYSISDDTINFQTHIPTSDEGTIYYVAFTTGTSPTDEVIVIESITPIEKSTQYSLDFNIMLAFNL